MTLLTARAVLTAHDDLLRALDGFDDASAAVRLGGLNEVAWMVAHLAEQEQRYWLTAHGRSVVRPELADYRRARPETVLPLSAAMDAWHEVADATASWLRSLGPDDEARPVPEAALAPPEPVGTLLLRVFGHYYLHVGQITAIRRVLGMPVPTFVGRLPLAGDTAR